MSLAILTVSCFLLYATSKYFPEPGIKGINKNKKSIILIASALASLSLLIFSYSYDFATSLMMWMIAFMTLLSAMILSLKMNFKSVWVWGGLCLTFILIDFL